MYDNIAKHNIKRLACFLAANLMLTSCCILASAKTVTIRGTYRYVKAGIGDGSNCNTKADRTVNERGECIWNFTTTNQIQLPIAD